MEAVRMEPVGNIESQEFGGLVWEQSPGAFELLEAGELDEAEPKFTKVPALSSTRGWPSSLSPTELKNRWQAFLQRMRGYSREEVVLSQEPVWMPLLELHVPPDGKASLTYQRTLTNNRGAELKILGIGFGNSGSVYFSESTSFDASGSDKALQVRLLITATKYTHRESGRAVIRMDLDSPSNPILHRVTDVPTPQSMKVVRKLDPIKWKLLRRVELSNSEDEGHYTWQFGTAEHARWKAELGGLKPLEAIGLEPNLLCEVEHSDEFQVMFEMPYGHDYVFYCRPEESPLTPFCARTGGAE
jgi:hypothetical protein